MTGRPTAQAGFTLLELLVALVVFGFLVAGLAQGTRFGLQAWATQTRGIDAHAGLDAADRTLRQFLAAMAPGSPQDPPNIVGTAHSLRFTTVLPAVTASREADVVLVVDPRAGLVLRWTPHRHAVPLGPPPAPQQVELLPGVQRLDLAYWRADGQGGWLDGWAGRDPPALVRIRLVFANGRHWPAVVVAPMRRRADE